MQPETMPQLSNDMSVALKALLADAQRSLQDDPAQAERSLGRAVDILSRQERADPSPVIASGGLAPWRMHKVRRIIEANMDQALSSADLAAAVGLSSSRFARAFRTSFGVSPHRYLMQARIRRAKTLMLTSIDALSDIALRCGLADQSHFSRLFRKLEGQTPAAWRRRQFREN